MLANGLRILLGQPYHLNPLGSLGRADKKRAFKWYPPSARAKWKKLRDMASSAGQAELARMIDVIYSDEIRNAFSHSDYVIIDDYFRSTDGSLGTQFPLLDVNTLITNAFTFGGRFISMRNHWLEMLGKLPRYHKWPGYEVFELMRSAEGVLNGFKVHFSTGGNACFQRTAEGCELRNVIIRGDGTIAPRYIFGIGVVPANCV